MPVYEFRCSECGHVFEELCRFDADGNDKRCSQCGHVGAQRLISLFAAHGLENGHHGVGKNWGGSGSTAGNSESGSSDKSTSDSAAPSVSAAPSGGGCGSGCACQN